MTYEEIKAMFEYEPETGLMQTVGNLNYNSPQIFLVQVN